MLVIFLGLLQPIYGETSISVEILALIGEIAKAIKARSQFINLTDEFRRSQNQTRIWRFSDTAGISRDGVSEIDRT
jgi:hypothetical protein